MVGLEGLVQWWYTKYFWKFSELFHELLMILIQKANTDVASLLSSVFNMFLSFLYSKNV